MSGECHGNAALNGTARQQNGRDTGRIEPGYRLVHIIDDDAHVRRSTAALLEAFGYRTRTWEDGEAFLRACGSIAQSCVILDLSLPGLSGLEVQKKMQARLQDTPVIFMTGRGDVHSAVEAMRSGAFHFLEKPIDPSELRDTLAEAFVLLDSDVQPCSETTRRKVENLTAREREVLEGLVSGLPNKSIAFDLGLSERTIEVHRAKIMRKLDAPNFAQALRIAFEAGL